jgi:hypothetical protein
VIDGNMKNHRDVCLAKDAGYIEFEGLPGKIKTGCQSSPQYNGRYCASHAPNAPSCDVTIDEEDMLELTGTVKRRPSNAVAKMIVAKKITRKETYYQVCNHTMKTLILQKSGCGGVVVR